MQYILFNICMCVYSRVVVCYCLVYPHILFVIHSHSNQLGRLPTSELSSGMLCELSPSKPRLYQHNADITLWKCLQELSRIAPYDCHATANPKWLGLFPPIPQKGQIFRVRWFQFRYLFSAGQLSKLGPNGTELRSLCK